VPTLDAKVTQLSDSLADQLMANRYLGRFREISVTEVSGIISRILDDHSAWAEGHPDKLLDCRDFLANVCLTLSIPVVETAYALYVLRDELLAQRGSPRDVSTFFERLVLELMRRY